MALHLRFGQARILYSSSGLSAYDSFVTRMSTTVLPCIAVYHDVHPFPVVFLKRFKAHSFTPMLWAGSHGPALHVEEIRRTHAEAIQVGRSRR